MAAPTARSDKGAAPAEAASPAAGRMWQQTLRVTGALLAVWLLLNLLAPWFARDLNNWQLAGFPLGWWIAAQGGLLAYLAIAWGYVWWMDRLEARYLAQPAISESESETKSPGGPA